MLVEDDPVVIKLQFTARIAVVVGVLYVCFVLLPPAAACLLYKWLLLQIAWTASPFFSRAT